MTNPIKTVAAVVLAVLAIRAVGAAHLTPVTPRQAGISVISPWKNIKLFQGAKAQLSIPVPNPAGVTVGAFAVDGVAVVAILTGGTHFLAVFSKEALGAQLVAASPIPASVAGDAASFCHLAGLLAFAVPASGGARGKVR